MKTKEELKELIEFARENHLESIEIDGMKFTLGSGKKIKPDFVEELKAEEMVKPMSAFEEMTDEEIQYWATPFYDELQARKEEKKNQKQIDDGLKEAV